MAELNPKKPEIRVPPPGPNAKKIVERDTAAIMTTTKTSPIAAARGEGVWIEDVDGNVFLDMTSGIGVVNVGHSNPRVVKAIQEQAAKLVHFAGTDFYYQPMVDLAERLQALTPGDFPKKVFYTNSGTESNEAAIKVARYATGRKQFLAFYGAFHGRTMGSLSFTASKIVQRRNFFPTVPGVHHAFFPNPYRNTWGIDGYTDGAELVNRCIDHIENTLFQYTVSPDDLAAVWVEPIQGEGGYIVPPKEWLPALRKLCDEHGILLCVDEVQTGFGRTGKMFAQEHFGVAADMTLLAKGIANGMPMGALVARADLDFDKQGAHSNTYGGNLVASASALATIDALTEDGMVENAAKVGAHFKRRLEELQGEFEEIGDVRGMGLMLATDFVKDRATKEPHVKFRNAITDEGYKRGLVLLPCGKSAMRYIPPLCITEEQVDAGIEVLRECMKVARNA